MKFTAKRIQVVEEEIDVDDRLYDDDTLAWQTADMFLNGHLKEISDDLLDEKGSEVRYAASRINEAFEKADKAILLIKEGKFEI